MRVWPEQVEDRRGRRREGLEDEGGEHAEVAATCTAQGPEQLPVATIIALDEASVRQDDLCPEQAI